MLLLRDEKRLRYILIKDEAPMQEMGYDVRKLFMYLLVVLYIVLSTTARRNEDAASVIGKLGIAPDTVAMYYTTTRPTT